MEDTRSNYVYGWCITEEILIDRAKKHDDVMGQIVLAAMGIDGSCTGFCLCKARGYDNGRNINIFWTLDDYDCHMETHDVGYYVKKLSNVKLVVERI